MNPNRICCPSLGRTFAIWFAAFALATRLAIPAGFMPASGAGYAIALCTGDGMVAAWVDANGDVHPDRQAPKGSQSDHPCAFAGLSSAIHAEAPSEHLEHAPVSASAPRWTRPAVSIGHGLAAPPPPSTGPPLLT
jgi:hypothetical protein